MSHIPGVLSTQPMTPQTPDPGGQDQSGRTATRRTFQVAVIYVLGGLVSLALAIPAAAYLLIRPRIPRRSPWIDAGEVARIEPELPVELSFQESRLDGWRAVTETRTAWIVKQPDGRITAFAPQCTHLGCAYHWESGQNKFVCPCHGSTFSIDGKVVEGPASRALDQYLTRIENNHLKIGELKPSNNLG